MKDKAKSFPLYETGAYKNYNAYLHSMFANDVYSWEKLHEVSEILLYNTLLYYYTCT